VKLALIADTFPPLRTSGAVQLHHLSRELVRQGHSLSVLLPESDLETPWDAQDFEGIQILRLKCPTTKDINYAQRTLSELLMPFIMLRNFRKSGLQDQKWDGVIWYSPSIFHTPLVNALKQSSDCPAYLIIRDIFPDWAVDLGLMRKGLAYRFFKWIANRQYAVADIVGVQAHGNLSYVAESSYAGIHQKQEVLQNWLGQPESIPCRIRVSESNLSGRKIFVYAGNIGIAQNMDRVIELAARMQSRTDVGFLFVGRGSNAERLKKSVLDQRLSNTIFFDEIEPEEIPDLYHQCVAGIVALDPRHKSHNIPGKFLTYVQNGLPVLANVNKGNELAALIRQEKVGEVCENDCIDDLEARCVALLANVETDKAYGERCKELFERQFSVARCANQICEAILKFSH